MKSLPWILTALLGTSTVYAGEKPPAPPAKYEVMDYGPFLSATFHNAAGKNTLQDTGCATDKGIAVKLGPEAAMLFDTDLLRMSGGWTGGFLKLRGAVFDGSHGPNPGPAAGASIFFQTNPGPGWSKAGDWSDPRKLPTGRGAALRPFGPLPREWAKYKGLYLHGDQIIFAYSVGTAGVLEMPARENTLLTRTLNITGKGTEAADLLVADAAPDSMVQIGADKLSAVVQEAAGKPESRLYLAVRQAPAGAELQTSGTRIFLKLPAFAGGEKFKVLYGKGAADGEAAFAAEVEKAAAPAELATLTSGGSAHWPEVVHTKGTPGSAGPNVPYVVDSIEPPFNNPYKSWIRFGGFDFFTDGRAALCTWSGDVWIASGLDAGLQDVTWRRFAAGLHQALGLKIVGDEIYVLGRDQITRLHDLNGDGEADFYENFNNDVQVTPGFHEFALDLHTDPEGNFYFAKGGPVNPGGRGWGPLSDHNGCIFKISKDGQKFELIATGVRAPNGMGVGPHGEITCGDNQGTWVPACYVHPVTPGQFIGVSDLAHLPEVPKAPAPHYCYLPMDVDNSGGAQVWVPGDQWGPFKNRLLHLSYGQASLHLMLTESVGGTPQGGAVTFPLKFDTGIMRARFNAKDGQLYLAGLRGWQTKATRDAGFYRVRYTGQPVTMQDSLKVTDKGITIGFSGPVEPQSAADIESYSIEQYNYRWTSDYGSADYKVSDPKQRGRDPVEIQSVKLAADGRSVFLEVPGLGPVDQMRITMHLKDLQGTELPTRIVNTINAVGKE